MAHMDIFRGDAFSSVSLTAALERAPYQPGLLGSMGDTLFSPVPVRTTTVSIEQREGKLWIINTTERGGEPESSRNEKRDIRDFRTVRVAKQDTIYASEIQDIRAFGTESELMQVQAEVARRFGGPTGLTRQIELTWEHMRLGAVQGVVHDADGSVIRNWFSEWSIAQPSEIDFALGTAGTNVRGKCMQVRRNMQRAAKGAWIDNVTEVHALAGDDFFDALIDHPTVRETYLHWEAAADLREAREFGGFRFGGIVWHNYRGTDDYDKTATKGARRIGIDPDKAKFFPVNAPGVFQVAWSPAESFEWVNTPGQPLYGMVVPDEKRNMFVDLEVYSYPLFICTAPGMLQRAKRV